MSDRIKPSDIRRAGLSEYAVVEGTTYRRRLGTDTWLVAPSFPAPASSSNASATVKDLLLIRENQAPGEVKHWLLFLASEGSPGDAFAVTGDAERMEYKIERNVDKLATDSFNDAFIVAKDLDVDAVDQVEKTVKATVPPSAPDRRSVKENCQGWTVRCLRELSAKGIVAPGKVEMAEAMVEPLS